ncbi:uncharacterized protein LOC113345757 isoform X2 [Papaver somniferum]|uniref:uncharacterized protein LOC113345757 isoform X2 n=1 Tax=Papaver somniferum TaxID=3469 RepID=UPI000E6F574D|nr:uncharacterized protein LOC113345757 isoform X2 [Papaver somniferum]XP_026445218.1 uncharacterized protein LOC113345757 isoform X2 [Papaver somniferum]XP_026445219.1 uncharacterized protein LOC113345757 isoform X2 [Papaver somniferum]XP_026445220.1 uncharacterized protein LOC113345757 isoform X2 [Papaver somniferum]
MPYYFLYNRDFMIKQALLDLGASVNLLPISVYEQLGLGELKPTSVTLQLADRSIKVPRGVVENVLIQIDKFYYPVDFIVLDTQPVANASKEIPIILGRPFLATANALINCRTGIMNLSFGNMTVELNIFDACKDPGGRDDIHEVNMIETCVHEKASDLEAKVPLETCLPNLLDFDEDGYIEEVNSSLNSSLLLDMDKWHSRFESLQISETEPLSPSVKFPKPNLNHLLSELSYDVLGQNENVLISLPSELNEEHEKMHSHVLRKHISVAAWSIADIEGIDPSICTRRKSHLNEP